MEKKTLNKEQIEEVRKCLGDGRPTNQIAEMFEVPAGQIMMVEKHTNICRYRDFHNWQAMRDDIDSVGAETYEVLTLNIRCQDCKAEIDVNGEWDIEDICKQCGTDGYGEECPSCFAE